MEYRPGERQNGESTFKIQIQVLARLLLLTSAGFASSGIAQSLPGWTLVWADEFA